MARNWNEASYPLSEVAEHFDEIQYINENKLDQVNKIFADVIQKNIEYRNRCKSEQMEKIAFKAAYSKCHRELNHQLEINAKLNQELELVKEQKKDTGIFMQNWKPFWISSRRMESKP